MVKLSGRYLGTYTFSVLASQTFAVILPLSVASGKG